MKKTLLAALFLVAFGFGKAQNNTLLNGEFWKSKPTLENLKAEIAKGNNPAEQNAGFFDPVVLAINAKAANDIVKFLIDQNGNAVDKKTHHSRIYLQWAAAAGNVELVQYLLGKGSDVHYKDSHGMDVITYAASAGNKNLQVFDLLIKAGADIRVKDENGANLLMLSIANDEDLSLYQYFTSKGISAQDKDSYGRTLADYSTKLGKLSILDQLIKKGIKPTDQALFFAAQGSRSVTNGLDVFQTLVDKYALKPTSLNPNNSTLLQAVIRKGNLDVINYLLAKGVDVNNIDKDGNTALLQAAETPHVNVIELLLGRGAKVNAANTKGETPLMKAFEKGKVTTIKLLESNDANFHAVDASSNNLAYYWFESLKINPRGNASAEDLADFDEKLKLLTERNVDVKKAQKGGSTLIHLAVDKNNAELLSKLLEMGIDINAKDAEGNTALHKAALIAKNDTIMKLLVAKGADKSSTTEFGETALELASNNEFLTQKNINLDFLK